MKNLLVLSIVTILFIGCKHNKTNTDSKKHNHNNSSIEKTGLPKKKVLSPHTSAMTMIGDAHIHIDYSSPGVRNRIIFGGLLPYNEVWQAGAHQATWLETNKDLTIADQKLSAGKYGFFVIPSQNQWTIIFNTNWEQHGKDEYDEKDDVIRFKVKIKKSDTLTEHLEYRINKVNETEGIISLSWEKVTVSFPFIINQ